MRSEKLRKRMAKKKETEPAPSGFGGFLSGAVSQFLSGNTVPAPPTLDSDPRRGLQNYLLPKKMERLERELAATRSELAAIKRSMKTGEKLILRQLISAVKKSHRDRVSDQRYIAGRVGMLLEKNGKVLADVCPKTWKLTPGLPNHLLEALLDDRWEGRVSQYISKSSPL